MEPVTDVLPSWLPSLPVLFGGGVLLAFIVLIVMRRRSVVVHGAPGENAARSLGGARDALQSGADPSQLLDEVARVIAAGRPINAMRIYRDATGVGLKEAKDAVELMQAELRGEVPAVGASAPVLRRAVPADASLDGEIAALLAQGKMIHAVKLTRERLHLGLKEAKDYVDDVQRTGRGARF